jgi:hypothetical protein
MEAAKQVAGAARLIGLEFPRTEIQIYGDTAILYTTYSLEQESRQGQRIRQNGRGTEIFVRRNGTWVNSGWNLPVDK